MTMTEPGAQPVGISRWTDLGGPVHYLDFGGPAGGPIIVCVHGLGGSAVNWIAVAPLLTGTCRVLAPDLAGHGLTQSSGRGTDVVANSALLHQFMESVPASPVILMGNSMGGMISLLEATAAPDAIAGLILVDPALPFVPARPDPFVAAMFALYLTPGLGRAVVARRRRLAPAAFVASILRLCCVDSSRVAADVIARHVDVANQRVTFTGVDRDFAAAIRSVIATVGYPGRQAYQRRIRSVTCPVLLIHGTGDRLVPVAAARAAARANPSWSLAEIPGVGHVPQLEASRETAEVIIEWLSSAGRSAAEAATTGRPGEQGRRSLPLRGGRCGERPGGSGITPVPKGRSHAANCLVVDGSPAPPASLHRTAERQVSGPGNMCVPEGKRSDEVAALRAGTRRGRDLREREPT
jgi:pimeloyl-ACP methyl ester carboxylesterase